MREVSALELTNGQVVTLLQMSYETADSSKEEFRKYLEKSGVVSQLTKVLVGLFEEDTRPSNAIDYIKKYLGAPTGVDVEELKAENEELKKRNEELQKRVDDLIKEVGELKKQDADE